MRKRTGEVQLWKQVDGVLQRRPNWTFTAVPTPGAPSVWCFGSEVNPQLTVLIDGQVIRVDDRRSVTVVELETADALVAWLEVHRPDALQPQRGGVREKLKRGRLFEW